MLEAIDNCTNLKTLSDVNQPSGDNLATLDLDSKILAATLNSIGDAVIATNTNSLITRLNSVAEELTGWTQAEAIGRPVDEVFYIIHAETRQPVISNVLETLAEGITSKLPRHSLLISRDGNEYAISDICTPIINCNNEAEGAVIIFRDISEQESVQETLRASEELFRSTFENASVGIAHVAHDGQLLRINQKYSRMVGYSVAELLFNKYQKITHPDDIDENLIGYERMLANEIDTFSMEKRYIRKDGSILWADLEVACVRDANHEIEYFIAVVEDISVRKQAIEDSRRFFTLSQELLCTAGFDGYFKKLNNAWEKALGYSTDELLAKPFIEFVHPDDRESSQNLVSTLVNGHNTSAFENRLLCKDGSVRWLLWSTVSVVEEQLLYASARDITERKKTEQDLQIRTEQFECLLNAAPFGIYLIDDQFIIRHVNPYALPTFNQVPDLIGRNFGDVMRLFWPTSIAEEIIEKFQHTLITGEPYVQTEMTGQRIDRGAAEYYDWQINRLPLPNGKLGVVCYFLEISERVLAQQKIRSSEWRLRYATESAKLTFVEIDLATGVAYTPENFAAVMGYIPPVEQETNGAIGIQALLEHVVPDDRPQVQASLNQFFNGEPVGKIDYRVLGDDNIERWIESKWSIESAHDGNPIKSFATNLDITERKLAELASTESEQRYHTLFKCMDEGYCVLEMLFDAELSPINYRFLEVNPAFEEQSGLVNATGKTILELIPDFDPQLIAKYGQVASTGEPMRFEHEVKELNRWFDIYVFRIKTPEHNKLAVLFNNITERKLAQQALLDSERRLQAFVMSKSDIIYSMNPDWSVMHQLHGQDFIADTKQSNTNWLHDYIHPDDQTLVLEKIQQSIQNKSIFEMMHQVVRVDNTLGWTFSRAVPIINSAGEITEWFGTARDVTERRSEQEALRQSEARFRVLFDLGPVAMYTVDAAGTIQEFNRNAVALWGREPLRGDPGETYCCAYKIYTPDGTLVQHAQNAVADVLEGRVSAAIDVEAILERLDGTRVSVVTNVVPLLNDEGEIVGAMNCMVDMTYRKNVEEAMLNNNLELQTAKLAAEKANLAKSEFLSNMSHELRTPLNAILGFGQLLETSKAPLTPTQASNVQQILKAGWYLLELINEILDLAQIESGKQAIVLERVLVTEIMRECAAMIEPLAFKYNVTSVFGALADNIGVHADKTRLKQIMINLLSNAIKYNKAGGNVIVDYVISQNTLRICVIDTGAGMSAQQLAQLFQPFNRLGRQANIEEGTGIGLMVCKRLIELMNGKIGVQSTVNVGSEFWIELDLMAETAPATVSAILPPKKQNKVFKLLEQ